MVAYCRLAFVSRAARAFLSHLTRSTSTTSRFGLFFQSGLLTQTRRRVIIAPLGPFSAFAGASCLWWEGKS